MEIPYAALNGAYWLDDDLAPCPDCARLLNPPPAGDTAPERRVPAVWRAVSHLTAAAHTALVALRPRTGAVTPSPPSPPAARAPRRTADG